VASTVGGLTAGVSLVVGGVTNSVGGLTGGLTRGLGLSPKPKTSTGTSAPAA
jgi:hypothetical protein